MALYLQHTVRVSVNDNVPGAGGVFIAVAQPPDGGVDLKWVAVKLESLAAAQFEPMPTAPCNWPLVLQPEPS